MNAIVAMSQAFLRGEILTIKTAFKDFGVSNLPREVSRGIEQKFGLRISRIRVDGKSRYGTPITWFQYRLNKDDPKNSEGIRAMINYCSLNGGDFIPQKRPIGRPRNIQIPIPSEEKLF